MGDKPIPTPRNEYKRILAAWMKRWRAWLKKHPKPKPPAPKPAPSPVPPPPVPPKPKNFTMFDSVAVSAIPKHATAVAGYVGGKWVTFPTLVKQYPRAKKLSIAVTASENAMCLDIESGDATPAQAPAWIRRQHARGIRCPVVYTSLAFAQGLVNGLQKSGLRFGVDYKLWCAHYTHTPHICSPRCGLGLKVTAHATQYTDKALGRNLDASLCSPSFL